MSNERYEGVFAHMKFPNYVFREYPKMLHLAGGEQVIVNSQKEEIDVIAERGSGPVHPKVAAAEAREAELVLQIEEERKAREKLEAEIAALKAGAKTLPELPVLTKKA